MARHVGRLLEVIKSVSLPPGDRFVDPSPSPSGLLYGAYLKLLSTNNPSYIYAIYPAYVNLSSGSLTVLNRFNTTLTMPQLLVGWYLVLGSSMVSSSLIIHGGVYGGVDINRPYTTSTAQPVLIYFDTSTYRLLNVSDLMPPASAVFGAYWSPWGHPHL